jgi:DHA2 family multidrug resistance protein
MSNAMGTGQIRGPKAIITIVVMLAAVMAMIDISIVNVALTDIRASFATPLDQIGWVSTGYMMANIVVIPMTGWFQRRFGYKKYFAFSVMLFTVASVLCGTSWNLPSLVAFRILQGLGGGAIIPTAQSILFARYPKEQHGMAAGLFGLGAITGPLLGPTIGGYLIELSSWHWIFLINVPIGIAVAALAWKVIDEPEFKPDSRPIDLTGILLLATGMPALQYVMEEGNREGWLDSNLILVLIAVAAVCLTTFIVHVLEAPNPIVDLRIFKRLSYSAGTGINFLTGLALFSSSYLFSLFCGSVMHYTALDIGKVFLLAGLSQVFLMPIVGRLAPKIDPRIMLFVGVSIVGASQWLGAELTAQADFHDLVMPQLVRAIGLAFIFIPLTVASLSDLPPQERGNATGLFNLTRELGGSLGTAWMGKVVADGVVRHTSYLSQHLSAYDPMVQERVVQLQHAGMPPEAVLSRTVSTQALVMSFEDGFRLAMIAILLGLVLVFFLKRPKNTAPPPDAH